MGAVIWGAGKCGARVFNLFGKDSISAFIDSNPGIQGTFYLNKPVISFCEYLAQYRECGIIVAILNIEDMMTIKKTLLSYNIEACYVLEDISYEFLYMRYIDLENWFQKLFKSDDIWIYGNSLYGEIFYTVLEKRLGKICHWLSKSSIIPTNASILCCDNCFSNVLSNNLNANILYARDILKNNFVVSNPSLLEMRNKHSNKKCVIVATGPSLTIHDLDILASKNIITFSMNTVYKCFQKTEWRPDYYVLADNECIRIYGEEICNSDLNVKFITNDFISGIDDSKSKTYKLNMIHDLPKEGLLRFSGDISRNVYCMQGGGSVVYICLQVAIYMGFSEIYLLGADCNYDYDGKHHFIDNYYNEDDDYKKRQFNYKGVFLEYQSAKYYAEQHGVRIYNATRGGKLEIFERVNFEQLF